MSNNSLHCVNLGNVSSIRSVSSDLLPFDISTLIGEFFIYSGENEDLIG